MSKLLNSEDFGLTLYNTLPPLYRAEDEKVSFALKRYLQTVSDGGFKEIIDEINGLINLIDPEKTPSEVLPIMFEHYGLKIFNGQT